MKNSKILIVYYSRTGTTKKVAEALKSSLNADLEDIKDNKNRKGAIGYLTAGKEASLKKTIPIQKLNHNIKNYNLVIIGTPIWAWTMCSPIRSFLEENKINFKEVAFFSTMGGSGDKSAFEHMSQIIKKQPIATLGLLTKEVNDNKFEEKITSFVKLIKSN